jgi:hypothetical protein
MGGSKSGGKLIATDDDFAKTVLDPSIDRPVLVFFTAGKSQRETTISCLLYLTCKYLSRSMVWPLSFVDTCREGCNEQVF